ncbi:hypothetical protein JOF56_001934 [Kibdelosporangium banguiense]|uniref:DUF3987 domain-containing protein n=1 Tax=Kibdelosporangium banguiense TaxID=1365924 RepID=A0ABS4TC43_9PSEU|nr:DUF3987 domain-containing protein [Kibdelosporangium banguiense]MBP2321549.1 hypothetical protein [Kibdelosporangium banguiense]
MTHANPTPPGVRRLYPVPVPEPADGDTLATRAADQVTRARLWLPPADPAVFDCYLGRLAVQLDPHTEADPIGVMVSLLAAAGVHLGPGPHLQLGYERHPLLVWPLVIGETGRGKKGTAYNAAKALLSQADTEFVASNVQSGLSSGEGLAAVFASDPDSGKGRARLLPEGDCRLLAYEPEWAAVMARMKREGNTLSATLRAAWEGGNLSTLNVDARVARRAHVGILAHITPKEFKAKVSASDMAGGTYNRFLPIAVAQSKFLYIPTVPDPALLVDLGASLADRLRHGARFGPVGLSQAGTAQWSHIYLEFSDHPEEDSSHVAEFISRAAPQCLRIAAIYAALDRTDQISPNHLTAAAALVRYAIASAAAVLQPSDVLRKLAAFIAQAGPDGRTREDIRSGCFQRNITADNVAALLDKLVTAGQITRAERRSPSGRGRPAEVFAANPPDLRG